MENIALNLATLGSNLPLKPLKLLSGAITRVKTWLLITYYMSFRMYNMACIMLIRAKILEKTGCHSGACC